ncbi:hypothetical protein ACOSQ2_022642 [Xanthoceras sorbifolium]
MTSSNNHIAGASMETPHASMAAVVTPGSQKTQVSLLSSNLNFKLPIKLDHINYNYWRMQVLPAIHAFDLEDFVLTCKKCPEKYIQSQLEGSNEFEQTISEDFLLWKKVDQLIVCWLFSTLSESIFGQVTHCTTAYEVWSTLENMYSQQSKARVLQLKTEMNSTKKGAMSINDYILKMKCLSESLAAAGRLLAADDVISSVLGGLRPEYDPAVVTITAKQGFISLQEVQYLLMSYEGRLAQHNTAATIDLTNASAHYSSSQQNYNNRGGRGYPNNNRG